MPAQMLPPTMLSPATGRELSDEARRDNRRTLYTATSNVSAEPMRSTEVGTNRASEAVTPEPTIAPMVAPAAMKPNRRFPCSELKMSTISAQKTETTNKLNTEIQMKNIRPIQIVCSGSAK